MITTSLLTPAGFCRLAFTVPPQLDAALGYDGDGQYFAVYWEPAGNTIVLGDGRMARIGTHINLQAWLALLNHESCSCLLVHQFGTCQRPAEEWFVFDRANRSAYAAPAEAAAQFICRQWPPPAEPSLMDEEEREHYGLEVARRAAELHPTRSFIHQKMAGERQAVAEMVAWLDLTAIEAKSSGLERRAS